MMTFALKMMNFALKSTKQQAFHDFATQAVAEGVTQIRESGCNYSGEQSMRANHNILPGWSLAETLSLHPYRSRYEYQPVHAGRDHAGAVPVTRSVFNGKIRISYIRILNSY